MSNPRSSKDLGSSERNAIISFSKLAKEGFTGPVLENVTYRGYEEIPGLKNKAGKTFTGKYFKVEADNGDELLVTSTGLLAWQIEKLAIKNGENITIEYNGTDEEGRHQTEVTVN